MKKIMILAVVAALVGLSLPQSVSAQTGSSTQDDQGTQATPNTQGTGTNSQGTGSSADPYGTGSQGTGTQGTGTQSESHKKNTQGTGTGSQGTGTGTQGTGTGSGSTGTGTTGSGSMGTGSSTGAASNYTEIKTTDLPSAVSTSISEKYPEYKTEKVFRGKDGTYKVKLSKDDKEETVFFDQRGDAVKMQK